MKGPEKSRERSQSAGADVKHNTRVMWGAARQNLANLNVFVPYGETIYKKVDSSDLVRSVTPAISGMPKTFNNTHTYIDRGKTKRLLTSNEKEILYRTLDKIRKSSPNSHTVISHSPLLQQFPDAMIADNFLYTFLFLTDACQNNKELTVDNAKLITRIIHSKEIAPEVVEEKKTNLSQSETLHQKLPGFINAELNRYKQRDCIAREPIEMSGNLSSEQANSIIKPQARRPQAITPQEMMQRSNSFSFGK